MARLAGNDGLGMFTAATGMAAKALAGVGPAGMVASAALTTVTRGASAFGEAVESLLQRSKELARYDGGIAVANALAQVRETLSDIAESRDLSEGLSRLTTATSEAWSDLRAILLPVKQIATEVVAGIAEMIATLVKQVRELIDWLRGRAADESAKSALDSLNKVLSDPGLEVVAGDPRGGGGGLNLPVFAGV